MAESSSSVPTVSTLALHGAAADTLALSAYLTRYDTHVILGKSVAAKEFEEEDSKKVCTYVVNNKYFTADLDVRRVVYGATDTEINSSSSAGSEGFVLVISQDSAESRLTSTGTGSSTLQSDALLAAALVASEDDDVSVRLVVVLSPSTGDGLEGINMPAREAWVSWCCDHSFEFVEVSTGTAAVLRETHDEREKDGLPRVVEALSSHMWRSMQSKGGNGVASKNSVQTSIAPDSITAADTSAAPTPVAVGTAERQLSAVTPAPTAPAESNPFLAELNTANTDEKDEEASLFSMVDQAKALRAAVDAGSVSDEQRKTQAESIALRFAAMLDMQGGDDEDDDSD